VPSAKENGIGVFVVSPKIAQKPIAEEKLIMHEIRLLLYTEGSRNQDSRDSNHESVVGGRPPDGSTAIQLDINWQVAPGENIVTILTKRQSAIALPTKME
jgi:hypothetical protein